MWMDLRKVIEVSVMAGAAFLEVGGDALIRRGLRGGGLVSIALGFMILGSYGVFLNLLEIDFTRLLGAYVGIFALASIAFGRLVFADTIHAKTWVGLAVVLLGSVIIQFGGGPNSRTP
jgi:small multidrug resistance family-3 protein